MPSLSWEDERETRWIRFEGELDYGACELLAPSFHDAANAAPGTVVVDLSDVSLVASQALAMLLQAHKSLRGQGRELLLSGLRQRVRRTFDTVGVLQAIGEWRTS